MINIVIINFNALESLERCLKSLSKIRQPFVVHLFDNSDISPYNMEFDFVKYYDNTKGNIIDFTNKIGTTKYASYTHAVSVQYMLDLLDEPFILLDSDVLLLKDISQIIDNNYNVISDVENRKNMKTRFFPHLMYLNIKNSFRFVDEKRIVPYNVEYDTSASLYEDMILNNGNFKVINADDYVFHEGRSSYKILKKREWDSIVSKWKEIMKK